MSSLAAVTINNSSYDGERRVTSILSPSAFEASTRCSKQGKVPYLIGTV